MRKYSLFIILTALSLNPTTVFAQQAGGVQFSAILLTVAILLGLGSSIYVFLLSKRLKGSDIGAALTLYGIGMLSVVVSLLSVTWLKAYVGGAAGWMHDGFFILGFLIMVFGSKKAAALFSGSR